MTFWRIANRRFATKAVLLTGEGAMLYGGRWNSPGRPAVYAAEHPALAILEMLVHLDIDPSAPPAGLMLAELDVPDALLKAAAPKTSTEAACRKTGDAFLADRQALGMIVPSVVAPHSRNVILNPRHPEARRIAIVTIEKLDLDKRLLS